MKVKWLRVTLSRKYLHTHPVIYSLDMCIDSVLCTHTWTNVLHQFNSFSAHGKAEAQIVPLYDHTSLHQTCSWKERQQDGTGMQGNM